MPETSSDRRVVALCVAQNVFEQVSLTARALSERGITAQTYPGPKEMTAGLLTSPDDVDVLVFSSAFRCDRELMQRLPRLRGVVAMGAGTETIDVAAATEAGIIVGYGPTNENTESMAESTIMLMLAALYQLNRSQQIARDGWKRPPGSYSRMLKGKTIGLVGFGRIARGVAERLQPWGATLLAYAPRPANEVPGVEFVGLEELLKRSDIVSLHATVTAQSRHLIDAARLSQMKSGALLINTARGALIDESALIAALDNGTLAGAALDTFEVEPLPAGNAFEGRDNVIITPHVVGHTIESTLSIANTATVNAENILNGIAPRYLRNPDVLERWLRTYAR